MSKSKNLIKFGLTALAALTLAACGSSGGGSDDQPISPNNPSVQPNQPSNNNTNNNANSNSNKPANNNSNSNSNNNSSNNNASNPTSGGVGSVLVIENTNIKKVAATKHDHDKLLVDGQELTIGYGPNIRVGSWLTQNDEITACCDKLSNTRVGIVKGQNGKTYVFATGNETTSMPTSGTAKYTGDAAFINLDDHKVTKGTDSVELTANFADKTLKGSVSADSITANVDAKISGNNFNGKATSTVFANEGQVEGKFYGENAKELGGVIQAKDWAGTFAASK